MFPVCDSAFRVVVFRIAGFCVSEPGARERDAHRETEGERQWRERERAHARYARLGSSLFILRAEGPRRPFFETEHGIRVPYFQFPVSTSRFCIPVFRLPCFMLPVPRFRVSCVVVPALRFVRSTTQHKPRGVDFPRINRKLRRRLSFQRCLVLSAVRICCLGFRVTASVSAMGGVEFGVPCSVFRW